MKSARPVISRLFLAALAVGSLSGLATAEDPAEETDSVWSDFDVTLGAAVGTAPDYEGSDGYDFVALPVIEVTYRDTLFLRNDTLGVELSPLPNLSFGPIVSYGMGRDEDDNDDLDGLGDIDSAFLVGGFVDYELAPITLSLQVLHAVTGDHSGTLVEPGLSYGYEVTPALSLEFGAGTTWASGDYMDTFFGIDATQAANSGLRRFDADSGFKDINLSLGASYMLNESWALFGEVGYARLLGDAADSPLVDDVGSADQFRVLTGISYSF